MGHKIHHQDFYNLYRLIWIKLIIYHKKIIYLKLKFQI